MLSDWLVVGGCGGGGWDGDDRGHCGRGRDDRVVVLVKVVMRRNDV